MGGVGLAVAISGLLLLWAPAASAVFPGGDGKLVVAKGSGSDRDLFTYNADGSGETPLLEGASNPTGPAVSADGRTVVFADGGDLWRMPLAGGSPMQLTSGTPADLAPAWTPDGRIWFRRDNQAHSMSPDGSDQRHELTDAALELTFAGAPPGPMGGCAGTDPLLAFLRKVGNDLTTHVLRCDGSEMPVGPVGNLAFAPNRDLLVSSDDLKVCTAASAYARCTQPYTAECSSQRCIEGRLSAGGGLLYGVRTEGGTDTLRACDADPPSGCSFGAPIASGPFVTFDAGCDPCTGSSTPAGPAPDLEMKIEMRLHNAFDSRLLPASFQLLVGNVVLVYPQFGNRGDARAENVVVTVDLPAGFRTIRPRCTLEGPTARCESGTIVPGESFGFLLVELAAERTGPFQLIARVSTTTPERDQLPNVATFVGSVEKLESIAAPVPQRVRDGDGGFFSGFLRGAPSPPDDSSSRAAQRRPGTERVEIAILRLDGRARAVQRTRRGRARCSWLASPRARFRRTAPTANRCRRPVWLRTTLGRPNRRGVARWSYGLRRGLPSGSYVVYSRAVGTGGAVETRFSARLGNRRAFRVRR